MTTTDGPSASRGAYARSDLGMASVRLDYPTVGWVALGYSRRDSDEGEVVVMPRGLFEQLARSVIGER